MFQYPTTLNTYNRIIGFGDILSSNQSLSPGQQYTFTFSFPFYSQYPSDADAINFLGTSLSGAAQVTKASRALFSSNYVVTIIPSVSLTVDEFVSAFSDAWKNSPWYVAEPQFIQAEGGATSSQPGGILEIIPDVAGKVGEAASVGISAAIKPILPYILIGGGLYLLIVLGPHLKRRTP